VIPVQSVEKSVAEIERCVSTQFDPDVVRVFLAVPLEKIEAIHANAPFSLRLVQSAAS